MFNTHEEGVNFLESVQHKVAYDYLDNEFKDIVIDGMQINSYGVKQAMERGLMSHGRMHETWTLMPFFRSQVEGGLKLLIKERNIKNKLHQLNFKVRYLFVTFCYDAHLYNNPLYKWGFGTQHQDFNERYNTIGNHYQIYVISCTPEFDQ